MEKSEVMPVWAADDLADLHRAKSLLENPGLTARLANMIGSPIEAGFELLPKNWAEAVHRAAFSALMKGLKVAILSMDGAQARPASNLAHKLMVGASGGIGGAFGFFMLPIELPISTGLMLRSIAQIAREEGQNIHAIETKLACLEVFAIGGKSPKDDAVENAYWTVRAALAQAVTEAASHIARIGAAEETAPIIVRLVSAIASRFGVIISEQMAAKALPVVGAVAGSAVNVLFLDHFQKMARGHFIVKRLEKKHGTDEVRLIYDSIAMPVAGR